MSLNAIGFERNTYKKVVSITTNPFLYGLVVDTSLNEDCYFVTTTTSNNIGIILGDSLEFKKLCKKYKNHVIDIEKGRKYYRKIEIYGKNPIGVYREMLKLIK